MSVNGGSFSFDDDEDEEEEWFGEDSPFDSGEELAAALVAMAGGDASALFAGLPEDPPESDSGDYSEFETFGTRGAAQEPAWGGAGTGHIPSQQEQLDAVLARVQPSNRAPVPTTWSSRNSVRLMKLTAQHMARLRNQAISIAWAEASHAVQQRDPGRRKDDVAA